MEYSLYLDKVSISQWGGVVLSDVSLHLPKGEFCYLIGKTGTGKSSLIRALYGDLLVSNGMAKVAGYDLLKIKRKQIPFLRRKIGMVFQDFKLIEDFTVYDNLQFVLRATGWKDKNDMNVKINEVLNSVNLQTKGFKKPFQLSGGEQQRVGIARALLNDPEIIIADEPTANLDPHTSMNFMELLERIHKGGKTVLMATHDYALILKFPHSTFKCENQTLLSIEINS